MHARARLLPRIPVLPYGADGSSVVPVSPPNTDPPLHAPGGLPVGLAESHAGMPTHPPHTHHPDTRPPFAAPDRGRAGGLSTVSRRAGWCTRCTKNARQRCKWKPRSDLVLSQRGFAAENVLPVTPKRWRSSKRHGALPTSASRRG